ncbi:MAG: hypothetical protein ACK40C_12820 [Novosphingobium meiothermophilum]
MRDKKKAFKHVFLFALSGPFNRVRHQGDRMMRPASGEKTQAACGASAGDASEAHATARLTDLSSLGLDCCE